MKHFTTILLAFGIMSAALPAARAADTPCSPSLDGSTVNGNLIVPPGAVCELSDVTVTGNVQVQTNALLALSGSTIGGNVDVGTGARLTIPLGSVTIDGKLKADQCNANVVVGGNVLVQSC